MKALKRVIATGSLIVLVLAAPGWAGESTDFSDGKMAASVLGQKNFTSGQENRGAAPAANTMNFPSGIAVDPTTGKVFVADVFNHRVLRFSSAAALVNGAAAEAVFGQSSFSDVTPDVKQNRFNEPSDVAIDSAGRLWVADKRNSRVLRFDGASGKDSGADADGVLGQPNFETRGFVALADGMLEPVSVAVESNGRLWVADAGFHRVLRFDAAAGKGDGADADGVLGQTDFEMTDPALGVAKMDSPFGVTVDASGNLWVSDSFNHRVLRFDGAAGKSDGAPANSVLGQGTFISKLPGNSASSLEFPGDLAIDAKGRLWVVDFSNNRVLRFDGAATKTIAERAADGVIGETEFGTATDDLGRDGFRLPQGCAVDGCGRLWVGDTNGNRVLRFDGDRFQPDGHIGTKPGNQRGNGKHNSNGNGQTEKVSLTGSRAGKAFFTVENDGDVPDNYSVKGTKGNQKLSVKYFKMPGGNVTGAMTRGGLALNALAPGGKAKFKAKVKGKPKSRGKRAGKTLTIRTRSQTDGETDVVKAKVKKTP